MFSFKTRRVRARRRGGLLAGAVFLIAAFAAVQAGPAAALGEQCSGVGARGVGAFLQTRAHQWWSGAGSLGFNGSPHPLACNGSQGAGLAPHVQHVPLGSAAALRHWGAEDGSLHSEELGYLANFVATDIAPSGSAAEEGTMLARMKSALGSDVAVVPVSQTAIAIAAHAPELPAHAPCVVPRINATQLQRVFSGELRNWRQLGAASDPSLGGDCDQAITRVVRGEGAGTTYQLKHYLGSVDPEPLACTGAAKRTWAQLQAPFGGEAPPIQQWPRKADCQPGEGPVSTVFDGAGEGEIGPLSYVASHPGTITYGSLPEAHEWARDQIVDVHNGVKFAAPETGVEGANCGAAKYTRPAGWASGVDVDWSGVYGSDPSIGEVAKNAYPICTLTYAVAATERFGMRAATTVHDYLAFVVDKEGGQAAVRHSQYADLPNPIAKAAQAAVAQIDGREGEEEGGEEEGGGGTVLCKAAPEAVEGVLTCPKGEGFSEGKVTGTLLPETVATFESGSGPEIAITCPSGGYVGEFNEDGTSAGGLSELSFGQAEGCSTTFPEAPEAVVSLENPPFDASRFVYGGASAPEGELILAKASKAPPLLRIQSGPVCVYQGGFFAPVTNGTPTRMTLQGKWALVEEAPEGACPTTLFSSAQMTVSRPGEGLPLYLAGK